MIDEEITELMKGDEFKLYIDILTITPATIVDLITDDINL